MELSLRPEPVPRKQLQLEVVFVAEDFLWSFGKNGISQFGGVAWERVERQEKKLLRLEEVSDKRNWVMLESVKIWMARRKNAIKVGVFAGLNVSL